MRNQRQEWIEKFRQDYVDGVISYDEYMAKVAEVDSGEYDEEIYVEPEPIEEPQPVNPQIFYGFDQNRETYRRQRKIKPLLVILTLFIAISVLSATGGVIQELDYDVYEWPSNSETAQMIPEPEGELTYISVYDGDYLYATVKLEDDRYCADYIVKCMSAGYNIDKQSSQYEYFYDFTAKNAEGWEVDIYNYDREMHISLYSPTWLQKMDTLETKMPPMNAPQYDVFQEDL